MNRDSKLNLITLLSMAGDDVEKVNRDNGWFDDERSFGDMVALLHSEVSEALEAFREWGLEDATAAMCPLRSDGESTHTEAMQVGTHKCKPEGVGSELADVLVRTLDMAKRYDIDLGREFFRKLEYNATRSHRHGGKRL